MSASKQIDITGQANGLGIAAAVVGGLLGYSANGWPGALAAGLAGYGAVRVLAHLVPALKAFVISGIVLLIGAATLAIYVGRIGNAVTKPGASAAARATAFDVTKPHPISFRNDCDREIILLLKWHQADASQATGMWRVGPNDSRVLEAADGRFIMTAFGSISYYVLIAGSGSHITTESEITGNPFIMRTTMLSGITGTYSFVTDCAGDARAF